MRLNRRQTLLAVLPGLAAARAAGAQPLPPAPLRVGWGDYPPFQRPGPSGPVGLDVELLSLLARTCGERLEWLRLPWARQLSDLAQGQLDLMTSATYTAERLGFADYTQPYRNEHVALLALAGTPAPARLAALKGQAVRIGVIRGVVFPPAVQRELDDPELQRLLVPMHANDLSLSSLRGRRVDFVIDDPLTVLHRAAQEPGEAIVVVLELAVSPVHLMVSRRTLEQRPALLQRLNAGLQRARQSGEWAQVMGRYPGV
jgi:ABC-type amino acid transport substrate-binding protein